MQALYAIGSGFFGKGLGNSVQNFALCRKPKMI